MIPLRCKSHKQPVQRLWQVARAPGGIPAGRSIEGAWAENTQRPGAWIKEARALSPGIYCQLCLESGLKTPMPDYDEADIKAAGLNDPPHIGLKASEFSADRAWAIVEKEYRSLIVAKRERPAAPARYDRTLREDKRLDPRMREALYDRLLQGGDLWSHQALAIDAALEGKDVVIETATASGKSLCYWVPIFNSLVSNEKATALYIAPLNALAEDQMRSIERFSRRPPPSSLRPWDHYTRSVDVGATPILVARYDGSTSPQSQLRTRIRKAQPRVLVTNPDMLHYGILPHHDKLWIEFFRNLRFIVIDELHVYKGMFGTHFANVLRRVLRIVKSYGGKPQIIACSASIGNPLDLFKAVAGRPSPILVAASANGAPLV